MPGASSRIRGGWARAERMGPLFPPAFSQPEMALPFEIDSPWAFTGGPHSAWEHDGPLAALDFAPASSKTGCESTPTWILASAPGLVVRSGNGVVVVDGRRFHVTEASPGQYRVTGDDGASTLVAVAGPPHDTWAIADGRARTCVVDSAPKRAAASRATASDMTAPMPATVVKVVVAAGG